MEVKVVEPGVDVGPVVEVAVSVALTVTTGVPVFVGVFVGVLVGVDAWVGVDVGVPFAGFNAISCVRLDAFRVSSFPVPTVVSPAVAFKDWDISAVRPFPEAAFFRS